MTIEASDAGGNGASAVVSAAASDGVPDSRDAVNARKSRWSAVLDWARSPWLALRTEYLQMNGSTPWFVPALSGSAIVVALLGTVVVVRAYRRRQDVQKGRVGINASAGTDPAAAQRTRRAAYRTRAPDAERLSEIGQDSEVERSISQHARTERSEKRLSVGHTCPKHIAFRVDMSVADIKAETQRIIAEERALADHISSLYELVRGGAPLLKPPLDFDHTFQLWADMEAKHAARRSSVTFPSFVSPHSDIRAASVEAQRELAKLDVELSSRADVYRVLRPIADEYEIQLRDALRRQRSSLHAPVASRESRREQLRHKRESILEQAAHDQDYDDFGRQTPLGAQAAAALGLTLEHVRYMRFTVRDLERHGAHLDDQLRERLVDLRTRIADLCIEYQRNLNEENTRLWFSAEELAGMSPTFLEGLRSRPNPAKPEELEFEVTLKYPHYFPIMKHCSVEETRRILEKLFHSRCVPENVFLLEETVRLRDEAAKLLGYPSHAAFVLEMRMANSPENVEAFLHRLSKRLDKAAHAELSELRRLKRKDNLERYGVLLGLEPDNEIRMWDLRYYMTKYEEQQLQIDHTKIAEYFPLERVLSNMLDIYQELLGLRFVHLTQGQRWHEDVRLFEVRDAQNAALLGYFYLDLHPREGKYGHAAVWPLQPSCVRPSKVQETTAPRGKVATPSTGTSHVHHASETATNALQLNAMHSADGERQVPVAAMVANLSKSSGGRPSLLRHEEVVTLFHEFGHVMHHLCSKPRFARFSGTRVERDFVEAPSQMLENWCWDRQALERLSGHYERLAPRTPSDDGQSGSAGAGAGTGGALVPEPLPSTLIERLQQTRRCLIALQTRRQIVLALFDQALHHAPTREKLEREYGADRRNSRSRSRSRASGHRNSQQQQQQQQQQLSSSSEMLVDGIDTAELLALLQRRIGLVPMTPGTHMGASFGHLMSGYDAQYYGYLWSEVYACDMYAQAFADQPLDPKAGYRYRQLVLAPGGSRGANEILHDFLGREPHEDAFFRLRGL